MKQTLLEIVVALLNATDGEEVNSISDTEESLQYAQDVKDVYQDIITRTEWQFLRKIRTLTSVSDSAHPNYLLVPENVAQFEYVKYNKRRVSDSRDYFKEVHYMYPDEFLSYVNGRDNTATNYDSITDFEGFKYTIKNDVPPTYYTSFDDTYLVFDSYDSDVQSTLQGDDSQASVIMLPGWTHTDDAIPDLPAEMFPYLLSECKSYILLKKDGGLVQKTEQTAGRQQRHLSQRHGRVQDGVRLPNYGRRSAKAGYRRRPRHFGPRS